MNATINEASGSSESKLSGRLRSDLLTLEQIHPTIQEARQEAFHQLAKETLARLRAKKKADEDLAVGRRVLTVMLIVVAIAFVMVGRMDKADAEREQSNYCHMVDAHKRDASIGWPDYKHTYRSNCLEDPPLKR